MSQDISQLSDHCHVSRLLSMAKIVAKWIGTHPLYISYLIFFSPYIIKLLYFLSPLLIHLITTTLCAFSTSTSNSFPAVDNETEDNNISSTPLEAEAYKIIFDNFHDSVATLSDESDEIEAYKQIKIEELPPEIVKSCCSSTPLLDPPVHEIAAKTAISDEYEQSTKTGESDDAKSAICDETEIIKHMVCSKINTHQTEDDEQVKLAVEVEINKAETIPFRTTTTTQRSEESKEATDNNQILIHSPPSTTTDLHKTNRSYEFSTMGSMRRDKEWRRTLACKLFEERHNNRGGEDGMDMLWETHDESIEPREEYRRSATTVSRRNSLSAKSDRSIRVYEDDEDGEGDDVARSGKMCCLHALKMSSGKVNLGIKTKNMIKFSKAVRAFGWLHKTNFRK